ncbi:DUF4167 domain-containing protein [Phenylobacterium sp.]|jgi:hypothetical protein|uniref:DUF4167 domain-containing protein n=1 Tax=Phenylobacterium sp. TaxID=1871053 RepID=UPI0025EFB279|nr:DUF4167 domain-containing protein [Phenylobacterium sp.]MCA6286829.1 DUF4167 domain-containing protein [Phenylobacterium sp.]MCA6311076.1 DUF4167 domain-containing protein [Phenylobacterium sp.]MCA6324618.1 DUF4167 domain-containing protein [Phenylobacterium sp.]MCA6338034.1 DUF4167 domain-containing protein [Phenylobacterium sp.]MCA6340968.1 DUF4167 domain-containing protein [Phenylobacterium sp.]
MRDFKGMKRQRGRNRSAGGKPQQHNANRALESNGPEGVKVRGNAQTVFERYQQLARDAASSGDRVLAENFLQHAEHYFRLIRAMQPTRPASEIIGRDQYNSGFDVDFEEEPGEGGAEVEPSEAEAEPRDRGSWRDRDDRRERFRDRDDRPRDDRPRDDRPRDERPREDRPREERPREERPREDRPRGERFEGGRRDRWRDREDRPERNREDRPERDPMAVVEPSGGAIAPAAEDRPPSPTLRSEDGAESQAPDFLRPRRPRAEAVVEEARPPRRRRAPRSFEGDEGQGGGSGDEG